MGAPDRNRRDFLKASGGLFAGTALAGCLGGPSGETGPTTIRYGFISGTQLIDFNGMFTQSDHIRENVLENFGEDYELELTTAQGTPLVASGMGAGEMDAGILANSSLANAVISETVPSGVSIVAPSKWQLPTTPDGIYARSDTGIETGQDLEGKSIATPAKGSASDIQLRAALVNVAGLDPEEDVDIREIGFGAMPSALQEDRVQAASIIQPFIHMMGDALTRVFESAAGIGTHLVVFYVTRNDFKDENPAAVDAWMEDLWTGIQWWTNRANRQQAIDIATEVIGLDRSIMEALVQTTAGYYHGEDGLRMNGQCLQRGFDVMRDMGFIQEDLTAEDYIDNSFLPADADEVSVVCD